MTNYSNKYLRKIAAEIEDSKVKLNKLGRLAEIGAGIGASHFATSKVLGYHKVMHGTSEANAKHIRKQGLDPVYGGKDTGGGFTEGGSMVKEHSNQSKGKIHLTETRRIANLYRNNHRTSNGGGTVLTARIPHGAYEHYKVDRTMGVSKTHASTTTHKISPKLIIGGKGNAHILPFLKTKHLKKYYQSPSGMVRGLKGSAIMTGGVLATVDGVKGLLKKKST